MEILDLRNIREARFELGPGLNVFLGDNAQGKTSLLEGVGLLARGRSFRTERLASVVRRGARQLAARGAAMAPARETALQVQLGDGRRRLSVDGREVPATEYQGRLEVAVYSGERLRVVRGSMRDRRQFLDRGAAVLWPAYRRLLRDYERVLQQRTAALAERARDLEAWDERLVGLGAELRQRRAAYVGLLQQELVGGFRPQGESYRIELSPTPEPAGVVAERAQLAQAVAAARRQELAAARCLVGPHRDAVGLSIDGQEAALYASAGQARSLLLALTLASLDVYRAQRGEPAVALFDDLDSELDAARAAEVCRQAGARGQVLVTTAHAAWAGSLDGGRRFAVSGGSVRAMGAS